VVRLAQGAESAVVNLMSRPCRDRKERVIASFLGVTDGTRLWQLQTQEKPSIEVWFVAEHIPARPLELARRELTAVKISANSRQESFPCNAQNERTN